MAVLVSTPVVTPTFGCQTHILPITCSNLDSAAVLLATPMGHVLCLILMWSMSHAKTVFQADLGIVFKRNCTMQSQQEWVTTLRSITLIRISSCPLSGNLRWESLTYCPVIMY